MVREFWAKLYPSTVVRGIKARRSGDRPKFTPDEMQDIVKGFYVKKMATKGMGCPRLHFEHSAEIAKGKPEGGVIMDLRYDDSDGWLYGRAVFTEPNRTPMEHYVKDGKLRRNVSLCYSSSSTNKNLIEFSLVDIPDFEGAVVVNSHSADSALNQVFYPRDKFFLGLYHLGKNKMEDDSQQQSSSSSSLSDDYDPTNAMHSRELFNGTVVVFDTNHVNAARAHLHSIGGDPGKVKYIDTSPFAKMTPEQQNMAIATIVAENEESIAQIVAEEAAKETQASQDALNRMLPMAERAASLVPDEAQRQGMVKVIAQKMLDDDAYRGLTMMVSATLDKSQAEMNKLREENERLRQQSTSNQLRPSFPSQHQQLLNDVEVMAHSGPPPKQSRGASTSGSTTNLNASQRATSQWQMLIQGLEQRSSPSSSSSSSSSRDVPEIFAHSGAKRGKTEPTKPSPFLFAGFDLLPEHSSAPTTSSKPDGIVIYEHSGAGSGHTNMFSKPVIKAGSVFERAKAITPLDQLTLGATAAEVQQSKFADVVSGRYPACMGNTRLPHDWLERNLATSMPDVFAAIMHGNLQRQVETNQTSNIQGYEQGHMTDRVSQRIMASPEARSKYCVQPVDMEEWARRSREQEQMLASY